MGDVTEACIAVIEVGGAPLSYEVVGTGPALVLLHEGIADSRMYDDQVDALARQYRVVRYDQHGFGRSGTPTRAYAHHEDLHALLRHLGIDRVALLGMSQGAAIALDFTLTYPARVGALLLLAPAVGGYLMGEATLALGEPIAAAFQAGDIAHAIELSVRLYVDGPRRAPDEVDPDVRARFRTMHIDYLRWTREGGRSADPLAPPASARLGEIHVPSLIAVGTGDIPHILEQADLLARTIPDARLVALPRVAHVFNMEQPAETNRLALDFLREHYPY